MKHRKPYRALLPGTLLLLLLTACDDGPKTYDACMLKASRESQNDRQFRKQAEACRDQYPDR